MSGIDLGALRQEIDKARASGEQENARRRLAHEQQRSAQFERETPEHLERASKILESLPARIQEAKAYGEPQVRIMCLYTSDYDYDRIPGYHLMVPLREAQEYIRRKEAYNAKPYLVMPQYLKPHSAAAQVLHACEQLGLHPTFELSGVGDYREAGALIIGRIC